VSDAPLALGQMLDAAAARAPDTPAIVFKDARVSYAELKARADAFRAEPHARLLQTAGSDGAEDPRRVAAHGRHGRQGCFYLRRPTILDISIVGVPDPVLGEVVMAFVIPKAGVTLTPQEIRDFAKDRIANFKVPRHVQIVSEFPLTGSGKVQKFRQKAWAVETYGFSGPA